MKELLDRYVRSLKERDDEPEDENDLGTFVCWILSRQGFTIIERAFKHEGAERKVSKGRRQLGIDIVAIKVDESGKTRSFRFVLKRGNVRNWNTGESGSLANDMWLACGAKDREQQLYGVAPESITVVAVHNGDRDSEALGTVIEGNLSDMRDRHGVITEWWDAAHLVALAEKAPVGPDGEPRRSGLESTFFPPAVQPFLRMALDSVLPEKGLRGSGFDLNAVDLLLERRAPLEEGSIKQDDLHRALAEFALFISMLQVECDRVGGGSTLPVLDTLEHVLCFAVGRIEVVKEGKISESVQGDLRVLLNLYRETAAAFRRRVDSVASFDGGLRLSVPGELLNYPIRSLRFSGYLAAAGFAAVRIGDQDEAKLFAATLDRLWSTNPGGCLQPITDDQLIEISIVFELWALVGMWDAVRRHVRTLLERLMLRRGSNLPLPSLWHRARVPMRAEDIASLTEAYLSSGDGRPSGFNDEGSTIIPFALYVADRLGAELHHQFFDSISGKFGQPAIHLQIWQPPDDAGRRWYRDCIEHDGTAHVLKGASVGQKTIKAEFERIAVPIATSTAEKIAFPEIDRIAWKVSRTPPPMHPFVERFAHAPCAVDEEAGRLAKSIAYRRRRKRRARKRSEKARGRSIRRSTSR